MRHPGVLHKLKGMGVEGGNDSSYNNPGSTGIARDFAKDGRRAMDIGELDTEWYSRPIDAHGAGREDWLNSENSKANASLSGVIAPGLCQNDDLEVP